MAEQAPKKLGVTGLSALVVGAMIGGGAFNLPSNMAQGAGVGAVVIAWCVTGLGMYFLARSFQALSNRKPELDGGIYTYAREGFGRFLGFEIAWGYWLSAAFGNVAFAVLIMETLGYFFPVFGDGKNWASLIGGSALIWMMHFIVLRGVTGAAALNVVATAAKLVPLAVIIGFLLFRASFGQLSLDVWGHQAGLGNLFGQVKSTMLVTLWVFIGIEGAVVVSGRARHRADVGRATTIGLVGCLTLYALLSVLPFAVLGQQELAALKDPSAAYLLEHLVGRWGAIFINVGVLISLLGVWLSWTILVAELPHVAARDGVFPKVLAGENRHGAPAASLWLSSAVMQATMFVVLFADNAWLFLLNITGVMVLPSYLASTAYLGLLARGSEYGPDESGARRKALLVGVLGSVYALWLLYAAGPSFLLMSTIFFALGIPVYAYAVHQHAGSTREGFPKWSLVVAIAVSALAVLAIVLFSRGVVDIF